MRKITLRKWKSINSENKEVEESTIDMISVLIDLSHKEKPLNGFEQFQIFSRLNKSLEEAKKNNIIVLEEQDYKFLKEAVEKHVPATWALNRSLNEAVNELMNAKEE